MTGVHFSLVLNVYVKKQFFSAVKLRVSSCHLVKQLVDREPFILGLLVKGVIELTYFSVVELYFGTYIFSMRSSSTIKWTVRWVCGKIMYDVVDVKNEFLFEMSKPLN